ncbi:calcium/sodium antiporter [Maritalea mediterranea]|uniref:Calcium/sodium antiporter n=1 Tax=Maritalea mediterranea TaxID=2909667 RepID=A0ABS9EC96_9HYPH|nr:calcium/sodium antiporter [Maritalea mediterranea]MCF4099048.1 calcium/sodium antiporter [Maritalea mediterranea]
MPYFLLILGLATLVVTGDLLVRGAVGVSNRMGIPPLVIGLTVVAFGTSAPELVVSISAALDGASGLSIGNVVGSNITNILLVLGFPALFFTIDCKQTGLRRSTSFMIIVSVLLIILSIDGVINHVDGLIFLGLLAGYLLYNGFEANKMRKRGQNIEELMEEIEDAPEDPKKIAIYLIIGIIGLPLGGKLTTDSALDIAAIWGVADSAVGLTIVALGTSLPELAAGMAAALRRHSAVAIGNAVGSNIFNILSILGITSLIVPLKVAPNFMAFDYWVMLFIAIALAPIVFMHRAIGKIEGGVMTIAYLVYLVVVFQIGHELAEGLPIG